MMLLKKLRKKIGGSLDVPLIDERIRPISVVVDRERLLNDPNVTGYETYLTVTAIIFNEGPYLKEWIMFHRMIGVQRFVLYDNGSTDDTNEILSPFVKEGVVEVIPWPNFLAGANHQHLAYAHASQHLAYTTRWLAVIDADEFLFSPTHSNVSDVLRLFEDLPALGVFLRCFGPSAHRGKPPGLVTANYTHRVSDSDWENQQYKSIVAPHLVRSVISAQRFHNISSNVPAWDENRRPLTTSIQHSHVSEKIRINHYATKSISEMEEKIRRRYFWSNKNDESRRNKKLRQHSALLDCDVRDEDIRKFLPELEKRMTHGFAG